MVQLYANLYEAVAKGTIITFCWRPGRLKELPGGKYWGFFVKDLFKLRVVLMLLLGEGFCSQTASFSSRSGASGCVAIWLI